MTESGKNKFIEVDGRRYLRLTIRTHVLSADDDMAEAAEKYVKPLVRPGDLLFVSEKALCATQGRTIPIDQIKPSRLARFLLRFVHKSPHGIGIASPWTMEIALREAGTPRILLAAFCSALTKPFGLKGVFYIVAGHGVDTIDGPADYVIPPYNRCAKLPPLDPQAAAGKIGVKAGVISAVVDANDLGLKLLGCSSPEVKESFCQRVFKDNPIGQSREQTPFCLIREVTGEDPEEISEETKE
jgi:F420-0:gamma-glutamyl ligase-like protein